MDSMKFDVLKPPARSVRDEPTPDLIERALKGDKEARAELLRRKKAGTL